MYGMPSKRFEDDYYKDRKLEKKLDFLLGFLAASIVWYFLFDPTWYIAPILIFLFSMIGILSKIKRRYLFYGMLAVVFFPLVLWGGLMIGWAGRNEIKS